MPDRKSEYDPDELPVIEPDEDPEYEPEDIPAAPTSLMSGPAHANGLGDREFEYRTEVLSLEQLTDGSTLPDQLAAASAEGWHYVDVVDAGASRVVLFRRAKKTERERRSVGFAPPGRS
ncbi:MAG TPA: hypothetical protein VIO86_07145 [Candidatus Dormibacteraeota bacterium]|jgi:hypothetical protein